MPKTYRAAMSGLNARDEPSAGDVWQPMRRRCET
jgi:hypothetical protein